MGQPTPKIFQTGAMKMEKGRGVGKSLGWGDTTAAQSLGALDAFPYLNFGTSVTINNEEDQSVTTKAFKTTPRMVGKMVENPLNFNGRFAGLNAFYYWLFGWENPAKPVIVFKAGADPFQQDGSPRAPEAGEVYVYTWDDEGTPTDIDLTFVRIESSRTDKLYVFSVDPAEVGNITQSGTAELTIVSEDPSIFTFTSHSGAMYEHLYEIDGSGRRYREYNTAEQAILGALIDEGDKKNLMCTLAKRMSLYDIRYANSMAQDFGYKFDAAGLAEWDSNFKAYIEERGAFNSSTWTLKPGLCDGQLTPAHFEHRFFIGEMDSIGVVDGELSGLDELALSSFNLSVGMPLQALQDTVSGLSIAEPVLEGKYDISLTGTISRHTVQTYQQYRDSQSKVAAYLSSHQGWYMQEFMIKEAVISEAGPDDSDVAAEPLNLSAGFVCSATHPFSDWVATTEAQSSPVIFRVRDYEPQNEMIRF